MLKYNSGLVIIWANAVLDPESTYKFADVPNLYNLREQVELRLNDAEYDFDSENA